MKASLSSDFIILCDFLLISPFSATAKVYCIGFFHVQILGSWGRFIYVQYAVISGTRLAFGGISPLIPFSARNCYAWVFIRMFSAGTLSTIIAE